VNVCVRNSNAEKIILMIMTPPCCKLQGYVPREAKGNNCSLIARDLDLSAAVLHEQASLSKPY